MELLSDHLQHPAAGHKPAGTTPWQGIAGMSDSNFDINDGVPGGETDVSDTFTETTQTSWLARIWESIKGVLFGLLLLVIGIVLLFWNEGRAVQTYRSLAEGKGLVVSADPTRVDPANEGKLVHVAGEATAPGRVSDSEFGVTSGGLALERKVEMFQWKEESHSESRKKLGGGEETVTTYSYSRVWSGKKIESSSFKQPGGHSNPEMRYGSRDFFARDAKLGAFRLDEQTLSQLSATQPIQVDAALANAVRGRIGGQAQVSDGALYLGANPSQPRIGDLRVTFAAAPEGPISVIGRQANGGFERYQAHAGDKLLMAESGLKTSDQMFKEAADENRILTWFLRAFGSILVFAAFGLMLKPLEVVADVVPIIGNIVGFGSGIAAALLTAIVAPITIAVAWFWYRPLVSLLVIAAGLGLAYMIKRYGAQKAGAAPQAARA